MSDIRTENIIFPHCKQKCEIQHLRYNFLYYKDIIRLFIVIDCKYSLLCIQRDYNYECNEKNMCSMPIQYFHYKDGNPIDMDINMYLHTDGEQKM